MTVYGTLEDEMNFAELEYSQASLKVRDMRVRIHECYRESW